MTLYCDIKHLEDTQIHLDGIGAIISLLHEKVGDFNIDIASECTRHQLANVLSAVSELIEQAGTELTEAIATAYLHPANFEGESFKIQL